MFSKSRIQRFNDIACKLYLLYYQTVIVILHLVVTKSLRAVVLKSARSASHCYPLYEMSRITR